MPKLAVRRKAHWRAFTGGPLSGVNRKTSAHSEPYRFWTPQHDILPGGIARHFGFHTRHPLRPLSTEMGCLTLHV